MDNRQLTFRKATADDIDLIDSFIRGIAEYEKMEDQIVYAKDELKDELFNKKAAFAEFLVFDNKEIGYAIYYYSFSTFKGHRGFYLEDLFILPGYRNLGFGKKTFSHLARIALHEGCRRFEWVCLNWNKPSISFYQSIGAKPLAEWTTYRLDKKGIEKIASEN